MMMFIFSFSMFSRFSKIKCSYYFVISEKNTTPLKKFNCAQAWGMIVKSISNPVGM